MKIKKIVSVLMGVTMVTGMLAGCGASTEGTPASEANTSAESQTSGEGTTLTMMCVGTESDTYLEDYQAIIDGFNASNEYGATVNVEFYENEQYKTKLTTLMASNAVPDIFFTWELEYLKPFVDGGKVADITSFLEADSEWKDSFAEGTLELLSYDGKNYAIPTQKSLCVMFYNKEIFAANGVEVPTTYEEFLNVCDTLKANGVVPMTMSGTDAWIPAELMQQLSNGIAGMDLYNGILNGETAWNAEGNVKAGEALQNLVEAGYFQDGFIGMGPDESTQNFENGKAAMYFQGAWDANRVYQKLQDNVGAFVLPAIDSQYNNLSVGSVDTSFAVSENCKNKEIAVAFLKYWTSVKNEEDLLYNEGRMPATVFDIDESKLTPLMAEVINLSNEQAGLTPWWDRAFGAGEGTEYNNTAVALCGGEDSQTAFDALQQFAEDNADR